MGAATPLYDEIPDHRHHFVNYVGRGFLAGAACGTAWYFVQGIRHRSSVPVVGGGGGRLAGGVHAVRSSAPSVAGVFGTYSALCCAIERGMAVARRRDDPWNCIVACAASLGLFNARSGGRAAAWNALYGAAVGAVFEGADWVAGEWDSRFASHHKLTRTSTNPAGRIAPATTPSRNSDEASDGALLSWLRRSTPSPSTISEKDLELLELSRKLLLEKMRIGFHSSSPVLEEYRFSLSRGGKPNN